jgi:uncharacterized protein YeaO (DUF488 family)
MPIQHAIWKVGDKPVPLGTSRLPSEQKLEEMIVNDLSILSSEWMLIGRQEPTNHGGRLDLLAIAPDGSLVLVEIKREKTPREIVAQAIDYASWVEELTSDKIAEIYQRFSKGSNLDEAFQKRFGTELDEETLNQSHQIVLVASQLDDASERIINYLNDRDIAINVVSFQVFQNGSEQLLSRAWLIDPGETQANVVKTEKAKGEKEPWNGEFYISFGGRDWEDARKYGYIGGGGGTWYSHSLNLLSPGDRVWVKIPHVGYVGVGRVVEASRLAKEFMVQTPEGERPALDIIKDGVRFKEFADDPEMSEYMVRVAWLDTIPESKAVSEVGMFGNQNTVCQPNTPKWRYTVDRLKPHFPKWDKQPV